MNHTIHWIILRVPFLVTFNTSFAREIGPVYAPIEATLEFEVVGDRTNYIDSQNIYPEVKSRILQSNGDKLFHDTRNASAIFSPLFVSRTPHFFFSERIITALGIKVSSANDKYAQKAFIET